MSSKHAQEKPGYEEVEIAATVRVYPPGSMFFRVHVAEGEVGGQELEVSDNVGGASRIVRIGTDYESRRYYVLSVDALVRAVARVHFASTPEVLPPQT